MCLYVMPPSSSNQSEKLLTRIVSVSSWLVTPHKRHCISLAMTNARMLLFWSKPHLSCDLQVSQQNSYTNIPTLFSSKFYYF